MSPWKLFQNKFIQFALGCLSRAYLHCPCLRRSVGPLPSCYCSGSRSPVMSCFSMSQANPNCRKVLWQRGELSFSLSRRRCGRGVPRFKTFPWRALPLSCLLEHNNVGRIINEADSRYKVTDTESKRGGK